MKDYILFDFDGTVFDTAEGITKCVQYALGKMGIEAELDELMCFAGPPLVEMFMQKYGMSEKDALHATSFTVSVICPSAGPSAAPLTGCMSLCKGFGQPAKSSQLQQASPSA